MIKKRILISAQFLIILFLISCSDSEVKKDNNYIIRSKNFTVTVSDYNKALEVAKTAFEHNATLDKKSLESLHKRLLNQMIEETILKMFAAEHKIDVSEKELLKAVNKIKEEFPDDTFEKTLLENAISYEIWEENLKSRMLMEKVIKIELEDKIDITPIEVKEFYEKFYSKENSDPKLKGKEKVINNQLIKLLRKRKAEKKYKSWLSEQEKKYPIEINRTLWEKSIDS